MTQYYDVCCRHRGKVVTIYETCGKVHVGKIVEIDQQFVYLEPTSRGSNVTGFGWGWGGGGWGYNWGYGGGGYGYGWRPTPFVPVALAAIGGFALGAAFFW